MKKKLFGISYSILDYQNVTNIIIRNAQERKSFGVSALAVHGLIEGYKDSILKSQINKIDLVVPDGQPIRWALNYFHKADLRDRIYGPTLTLKVLEKANETRLNVFLYGSTENTLNLFSDFIRKSYTNVNICGIHIDRFREATQEENEEDIKKINESNSNIVLVGRGCPRQEKWVANNLGKIDAVMMAVGAAFDFHAGTIKQAPIWMQKNGLEWLFRLIQEPNRLWKRYLITNSYFIYLFSKYTFLKLDHE